MVSKIEPHSYEAAGVLLPVPVAGHPALELCNTLGDWTGDGGTEYLADYRALVVWARERGLLDDDAAAGLADAGAADVLARARRFRAALYAVVTGSARDRDRHVVAREVERAAAAACFVHDGDRAAWRLPVTPELPLQAAAAAAGELLVAGERVGRCPGRHCGWLFLNPRGTRRWCSMATCGNRAKVAKHAKSKRRER